MELTVAAPAAADNEVEVFTSLVKRYFPERAVRKASGEAFCRPVLFAFGASDATIVFAEPYLRVYLCGAVCPLLATGLNGYINAQGFPKIGMLSVVIGAAINIALDPVFIFALKLGVVGAALATVISQAVSAAWVLRFLTGRRAPVRLTKENLRLDRSIVDDVS